MPSYFSNSHQLVGSMLARVKKQAFTGSPISSITFWCFSRNLSGGLSGIGCSSCPILSSSSFNSGRAFMIVAAKLIIQSRALKCFFVLFHFWENKGNIPWHPAVPPKGHNYERHVSLCGQFTFQFIPFLYIPQRFRSKALLYKMVRLLLEGREKDEDRQW